VSKIQKWVVIPTLANGNVRVIFIDIKFFLELSPLAKLLIFCASKIYGDLLNALR
jgi:hypothetical protein